MLIQQPETQTKVIRYYRKNVYGVEKYYPVDFIGPIETLTGMKTLVARNFSALEAFGFQFVEVLESSIKQEVAQ